MVLNYSWPVCPPSIILASLLAGSEGYFFNYLNFSLFRCSGGISEITCEPLSLHRILESKAFDFYLISSEPSLRKSTKIPTILSSSLSKNLGRKAMFSSTLAIEILIGTAREV